ncbi:MAG: nucleoside 2-deoxyribosyltransferase, partial [Fidelibacterota bacterium]
MKIYFSGAIRGGRKDVLIYQKIINHLATHGTVLTAFIGDPNLDTIYGEGRSDKFIWERDVTWVRESDVLVAEVTQTSLGVGYEIAIAHTSHVPVLA